MVRFSSYLLENSVTCWCKCQHKPLFWKNEFFWVRSQNANTSNIEKNCLLDLPVWGLYCHNIFSHFCVFCIQNVWKMCVSDPNDKKSRNLPENCIPLLIWGVIVIKHKKIKKSRFLSNFFDFCMQFSLKRKGNSHSLLNKG